MEKIVIALGPKKVIFLFSALITIFLSAVENAECASFNSTTGAVYLLLRPVCGDGDITGTEVCDGANLGSETCQTQGYLSGTLACNIDCGSFDTSGCYNAYVYCSTPGSPIGPSAGTITTDQIVVPPGGEWVTDVNVYLNATHTWLSDLEIDVRHIGSDLSVKLVDNQCSNHNDIDATFDQDATGMPDCVDPIAIEGSVLPSESLNRYIGMPDQAGTWELSIHDMANGDGGTLIEWCMELGTSATEPVATCGDGDVWYAEQCDGVNLLGQTCASLGWVGGGTLACDPASCLFDTSLCVGPLCGDSSIVPPEQCDTNELGGSKCEDLGFVGGSLDCTFPSCGYDTSQCSNSVVKMCVTPGMVINTNSPPHTSIITLSNPGTVGDVDVFVNLTHTWLGDIDMYLINQEAGISVELATDRCVAENDMFAFYNDEGNGFADCIQPIGAEGNLTPEGNLSDMDGLPIAGDWVLQIADDFPAIDDGVLVEWCIYITPQ